MPRIIAKLKDGPLDGKLYSIDYDQKVIEQVDDIITPDHLKVREIYSKGQAIDVDPEEEWKFANQDVDGWFEFNYGVRE